MVEMPSGSGLDQRGTSGFSTAQAYGALPEAGIVGVRVLKSPGGDGRAFMQAPPGAAR
jgi:hypothetical protein